MRSKWEHVEKWWRMYQEENLAIPPAKLCLKRK